MLISPKYSLTELSNSFFKGIIHPEIAHYNSVSLGQTVLTLTSSVDLGCHFQGMHE